MGNDAKSQKGQEAGKISFCGRRSWVLLTKCTSHAAFWKHHRLEWQSTLVASQTPGNFLEFLQQLLQKHLSAIQIFGSAAVKYFNSRLPDSHFNGCVLVVNPSKLLFTKTTFCNALRQEHVLKEAWAPYKDPTRASLCLVAFLKGISECHSGCAKGDHKAQGEQKLCSPAEKHFVFFPHGTWKFYEMKFYEVENGKISPFTGRGRSTQGWQTLEKRSILFHSPWVPPSCFWSLNAFCVVAQIFYSKACLSGWFFLVLRRHFWSHCVPGECAGAETIHGWELGSSHSYTSTGSFQMLQKKAQMRGKSLQSSNGLFCPERSVVSGRELLGKITWELLKLSPELFS